MDYDSIDSGLLSELVKKKHIVSLKLSVNILDSIDLIPFQYHKTLCDTLDDVIEGKITRLIINIPPSYGKTLAVIWSLVARMFVINPRCRILHTSYSQDLALDNSAKIKQLLRHPLYQRMTGYLDMVDDTKSKGLWRNTEGGGMRSVQSGGGITGFRAGYFDKTKMTGMILIDDPIKPDDARSSKRVMTYNDRYNNTIASRLAHEAVPIILIMQRVCAFKRNPDLDLTHVGDMSEYLLMGGSGEKWHHLMLPVKIDNSLSYPKRYTHGIEIEHHLPDGVLSPMKHTIEDVERLERANKFVYNSQYLQRPLFQSSKPVFDVSQFRFYETLPVKDISRIFIVSDTASKTESRNDYSVFLSVAQMRSGECYMMDMEHLKLEAPELIEKASAFYKRHKRGVVKNRQGVTAFYIEDASSGIMLIQTLKRTLGVSTIKPITRTKDKFTRAMGVLTPISEGKVYFPMPDKPCVDMHGNYITSGKWVNGAISEVEDFREDDSHLFDDRADVIMDAIELSSFGNHNIYNDL